MSTNKICTLSLSGTGGLTETELLVLLWPLAGDCLDVEGESLWNKTQGSLTHNTITGTQIYLKEELHPQLYNTFFSSFFGESFHTINCTSTPKYGIVFHNLIFACLSYTLNIITTSGVSFLNFPNIWDHFLSVASCGNQNDLAHQQLSFTKTLKIICWTI